MSQLDELPEGWEICTFEDLFDFKGGSQPPKSAFIEEQKPGYIRLLQIRDFESDKLAVYIKDEDRWPKCEEDDILIARYGASLGRILSGKRGAYNVALVKLVFDKFNLDKNWVQLFLKSRWFQEPLFLVSRSAQSGFNKAEVFPRPVPLPPLNEQRRIVEKIEALTARSRKAREALEAIPNLLDQFRQSVLAAAFRGDLTADWREQNPDVEPAEVLLEKVQKDIASQYLEAVRVSHENGDKKSRKPPLLNLNIKSYSQHHCTMSSWLGVELEALAPLEGLFDGPFGSNLKTSDYVENGVRVIRLENIGFLNFIGNKSTYISHEKYKMLEKHTVFENDLLFASFASEGVRACLLPPLNESAIAKADCFCLRPYKQLIDKEFLLLQLSSPSFYKQLESLMHGATRLRVSLTQLRKAKIWLCSVEEQREIVRRVRQFFNIADFIEQEYQDSLGEFDQLDQSILAKAFRGELVPQDPNDEPANLLLERIRAERERLGNSKKRGKAKT